jgi:hypothetical protein
MQYIELKVPVPTGEDGRRKRQPPSEPTIWLPGQLSAWGMILVW